MQKPGVVLRLTVRENASPTHLEESSPLRFTGRIAEGAVLARLARDDIGIIMIPSDLPEVLAISDLVAVVKEARINCVLPRSDASEERIMQTVTGRGTVGAPCRIYRPDRRT